MHHVLVNIEPGRKIPAHIEELLKKVCSENPLDPKINKIETPQKKLSANL